MLKNIINSKAREGITSAWKSKIEAAHKAASEASTVALSSDMALMN